MTDQEHADAIKDAVHKVVEAIQAAKQAGLVVTPEGEFDIRNAAVMGPHFKVARYYP